jgi:hypothetical protein
VRQTSEGIAEILIGIDPSPKGTFDEPTISLASDDLICLLSRPTGGIHLPITLHE